MTNTRVWMTYRFMCNALSKLAQGMAHKISIFIYIYFKKNNFNCFYNFFMTSYAATVSSTWTYLLYSVIKSVYTPFISSIACFSWVKFFAVKDEFWTSAAVRTYAHPEPVIQ